MAQKSALDAVIDEMSLTSELTPEQLRKAIIGIMEHLRSRAQRSIEDDAVDEVVALEHSYEFLAFTQLVHFYGTALIAIDDIEVEDLPN